MKAYQRIIRENKIIENPLNIEIDLHKTEIREITYEEAKKVILEYEWLGTMGFTIKSIGQFYNNKLISVLNLGFPGGTQSRNICGEEHANKAVCLVRGACIHFTPKYTPSYFISRALKYASQKYGYKIFYAYADESAGEIGTIYQALNWYYLGRGVGRPKGRKRESFLSPEGIHMSERSIRNRGWKKSELIKKGWKIIMNDPKHKYVWFEGTRLEKKYYRTNCKYQFISYPKRENTANNM